MLVVTHLTRTGGIPMTIIIVKHLTQFVSLYLQKDIKISPYYILESSTFKVCKAIS